jgi:hypothetical protein
MSIIDGVPFLRATYFTPGRDLPITDIVVHWMCGTLAGTDATFTNGSREASAHFGIEGAKIHQYVALGDTAWHAANHDENNRSVGIEHSGQPGRDPSAATVATSVAVIVALCRRYNIDPSHIYPHKKFTNTDCPGTLPVADIIARVRAQLGGVPPKPSKPGTRNIPMTKAIQAACHQAQDGCWGPATARAADGVIRELEARGSVAEVRYLQAVVGTVVDGAWGPASEAARVVALRKIQAAIGVAADGAWGPISQAAWLRAYNANYGKF